MYGSYSVNHIKICLNKSYSIRYLSVYPELSGLKQHLLSHRVSQFPCVLWVRDPYKAAITVSVMAAVLPGLNGKGCTSKLTAMGLWVAFSFLKVVGCSPLSGPCHVGPSIAQLPAWLPASSEPASERAQRG